MSSFGTIASAFPPFALPPDSPAATTAPRAAVERRIYTHTLVTAHKGSTCPAPVLPPLHARPRRTNVTPTSNRISPVAPDCYFAPPNMATNSMHNLTTLIKRCVTRPTTFCHLDRSVFCVSWRKQHSIA